MEFFFVIICGIAVMVFLLCFFETFKGPKRAATIQEQYIKKTWVTFGVTTRADKDKIALELLDESARFCKTKVQLLDYIMILKLIGDDVVTPSLKWQLIRRLEEVIGLPRS